MTILEVQNLNKHFGGIKAINNCSFSIEKNSITGLIGPNGAGKTTMFNILSGLLTPDSGSIYYQENDITNLNTHERTKLGFGRSFQSIRIFPELTTIENLILAFPENNDNLWQAFSKFQTKQKSLHKKALELLTSVNLEEKANLKGYELSYGQKKLLEILRVEANNADLVLLDEPTAGINPTLIQNIKIQIKNLQKAGKTIFIVEHNMPFIMNLCEQIIVMDQGKEIAMGTPKEIQENPQVLVAYLGKKRQTHA
ncbi:ABC transporter ATP-binding protein [Candidatus Peregrinibacteria bacterium]|nr:ABC transporter ATP-binding protein [Candidatus Peregrinibacteria bacterium]